MAAPIPIAIIGMSFRGPGGAESVEAFWDMIYAGQSAWSEVPAERWNGQAFYHPDVYAPEANNSKGGHFIKQDMAEFDAGFFGIQESEAKVMDPQQRLSLELAWEAFENAGAKIDDLRGSETGVYMAAFTKDYENNIFKDTRTVPSYMMTGTGTAIMANRISYCFDLRGPSFVLDTGCSGSLVALHQACQSLRLHESKMALVGGANLILSPDIYQPMSLNRVLNDDGKCYTFDHRGTGYGRGEGVGCVVLKRLDDAIRDGDAIRSIIRNTGVNQDGKTNGISLPNQFAQENLIRATYAAAGLDTKDTDFVEAHGTGTQAGDKIEVAAIANTFNNNKNRATQLFVASVKTNIGHLESASGIAGLIKTVLAMERGIIPPHINFEKPKEGLNLEQRNIKIPLSPISFPENVNGVRRASVNSFGYGGTNAHAILELPQNSTNGKSNHAIGRHIGHTDGENGHAVDSIQNEGSSRPWLFVISARTQWSVLSLAEKMKQWVKSNPSASKLGALSNNLVNRRSTFPWRSTFVASTAEDLMAKLGQAIHVSKEATQTRIAMIFSGQGAQWHSMGRELISTQSKFRDSILQSEQFIANLGATWQLTKVLLQDEKDSIIDRSDISQPACTALQIALVDLLESWNIRPQAVIGHSSGEIAAAYAAGALTHKSAVIVAYKRGFAADLVKKALQVKGAKGAMLAVGLGEDALQPFLAQINGEKAIVACINSPKSVTVSGDIEAIESLGFVLDSQDDPIFNRKLKVDIAYHSHHMAVVADDYLNSMAGLETYVVKQDVKFFSTVTGRLKSTGFGPQYWVGNLIGKVKFSEALQKLTESQWEASRTSTQHLLIEIGPHSALSGPIRQTIAAQSMQGFKHSYSSVLTRNQDAIVTTLEMVGKIFEAGHNIDLKCVMQLSGKSNSEIITDLPPYAWDHSNAYWSEPRLSKEHRLRKYANHDILGLRVLDASLIEPIWRNILTIDALPWLKDHVVDGLIVFPGTGYLCMALEAVRQMNLDRQIQGKVTGYRFQNISLSKALVLAENGSVEIQLTLKPAVNDHSSSTWEDFKVFSRNESGTWNEHCRGSVMTEFEALLDEVEGLRESVAEEEIYTRLLQNSKAKSNRKVNGKDAYQLLEASGNFYGPTFAAVKELSLADMEGVATIQVPYVAAVMPLGWMSNDKIHPATLDAIFHMHLYLFFESAGTKGLMPITIPEVYLSASLETIPGDEITVVGTVKAEGIRAAIVDAHAFHGERMLVSICNVEMRAVGQSQTTEVPQPFSEQGCNEVIWEADVDFLTKDSITESAQESERKLSLDDQVRLLETTAGYYVQQCLVKLDEAQFTPKKGHHIAFLDWMRRYKESDVFKTLIHGPNLDSCLSQLHGSGPEIELLTAVGPYLSQIILGQSEVIELMMNGDLLYRFYQENMWSKPTNAHAAAYFKAASFKNPDLKVLEVGSGTGGTTIPVLNALSREHGISLGHYTFTDISSGFFGKVKPALERWSDKIDYRVLDIEKSLDEQGFEEGSYDVVLAALVIHATADVTTTLGNVRRLLKPGGRLVLIELTQVTAWVNCIFGATAGWWAGNEESFNVNHTSADCAIGAHQGRVDSPLLSVAQWGSAIETAGFGDVELATDVFNYQASVIVASVRPTDVTPPSKVSRPLQIIKSPSIENKSQYQSFANELLAFLQSVGYAADFADFPSSPDKSVKYVVLEDGAQPLLVDPTEDFFRKLVTLLSTGDVLWISGQTEVEFAQNPDKGIFRGFERVARAEFGSKSIQYIDVQDAISEKDGNLIHTITSVVQAAEYDTPYIIRGVEPEYIYRNGKLNIPRLIPSLSFNQFAANTGKRIENVPYQQSDRPIKLHVDTPGLLDSMIFIEDTIPTLPIGDEEIEVESKAFGLNFKDVYIALGQMRSSDLMVGEMSGVVTRVGASCQSSFKIGDKVFGWHAAPFASRARVHMSRACQLPAGLSFTEGASVPVVFMTAYLALVEKAHLETGQSVLIHAGSGGVGQAAIQIAQNIGAEVFVTVGSASKKNMLKDLYGLPESHIFSSRLRSFKAGILRLTCGRGVDVVLNSLSGEALIDSWACVASLGTFIEIGKTDIYQNTQLGMYPLAKSINLVAFDLGFISAHRPSVTQKILQQVALLLEQHAIRPVHPVTVMPINGIEDAFRLIQARKHTGKVVLEAKTDSLVRTRIQSPPSSFDPFSTFIIAGGLGDLGLEMCKFLARHGAKHIVTLSRRAQDSKILNVMTQELSPFGTKLHALRCDITRNDQVETVAKYCASLPPIKALIQAAMVLNDVPLEVMDVKKFATAVNPKVLGTRNLAQAFPECDAFILLSSMSGVLGNRGQGNYAAGCAYQDTVAQNSSGKTHFVSLNLPLVFGTRASDTQRQQHMSRQGIVPMNMEEFFVLLDYSLSSECREKGIKQILVGLEANTLTHMINQFESANPMFCHLMISTNNLGDKTETIDNTNAHLGITSELGVDEILRRLVIAIAGRISALAAIDYDEVDVDVPILEFGLDSLVTIELKNWLTRTFKTSTLETSEILGMPSIKALANLTADRSSLVKITKTNTPEVPVAFVDNEEKMGHDHQCCKRTKKLRKLPLLGLETLFQYHLANHRAIWTEKEYEDTVAAAIDFQKPNGIGQKLYDRLVERYNSEENWLTEITTRTIFLDRRYSLVKSNIGCSHRILENQLPHTQTERAALVALETFKFKLQFESGEMEPSIVNGTPLCMRGHEWLFHSCREPRIGSDETNKFPSNNTIVVLHRGNVFKFDMINDGKLVTHHQLKATFQAILDAKKEESAITMLTTMERNEWAEIYQNMKLDPQNKTTLEAIETSAFIISLEDASPTTPRGRMDCFLFGDGSNRWYDKTVSFIVCANGVSGFLGEHSQVDGATMAFLNAPILQAVYAHSPDPLEANTTSPLDFEACEFNLSSYLPPVLSNARQVFLELMANVDFELAVFPILGASFLNTQNLSAIHSWEIITQVASRLFFGYQPASWSAVLMDVFHQGRPDVIQVCTPTVVKFIDAAIKEIPAGEEEGTAKKELRKLFQRSVKDLASSFQRAQMGHAHDRTFTAMEWVLKPDEEAPILFKSDAGYYNSRPRHIMAGVNTEMFGESGFVLMDPKSVWMTYNIEDEGARYSIVNAGGKALQFADCLNRAGKIVENFLMD